MRLELLSALSGVLIAAQSRINGALSEQMGDSLEAAIVSFSSGLLFVSLIALSRKDVRDGFKEIFIAVKQVKMPPWTLAAGALGASFVAMQTYVVPIAGVALFTVASLAGQTGISLWVDRLGLTGGAKAAITKRRIMAAVITVLAVLVSSWDRFAMSDFSILAIGLAVFAGTWVGLQRALNGQINSYSKRSFATSQLNFITGTSFLLLGGVDHWVLVAGLVFGGLFAAPFAAYLTSRLSVRFLLVSVGLLISTLSAFNLYKILV